LDHIFNRFYQNERIVAKRGYSRQTSSGIGLSLTKALVELHKGSIEVSSQPDKGTTFRVKLPIGNDSYREDEMVSEYTYEEIMGTGMDDAGNYPDDFITEYDNSVEEDRFIDHSKPVLLIAEDNHELRDFIKNDFKKDYTIIEAADGREAYEKCLSILPNVIITDIMMPEMDGLELCEKVKNHEITNHIPVILLTARSTYDDRIHGLEKGADSYIPKPFHIRHLKVRVEKLLESREILKKKYSEFNDETQSLGGGLNHNDKKFIDKVDRVIEENLLDTEFNVDTMGCKLAYSRMQLYRKMKAITNLSPVEYIRNYRLTKAAKLLKENSMSVKEILYSVGFNNPSYFYRAFRDFYGVSPKKFAGRIN
jgi:DNA-binding response OmpR family regulator